MISKKNAKITSMISSFENCANLNSFKINDFDTNEVKSISKLFYNTSLNILNIENFNINNVEDMSYMLSNSKLEQIDLSKLNLKNVKNMSHMFYKCSSLTSINLTSIGSQVICLIYSQTVQH